VKPEELLYAKTHEWVYLYEGGAGERIARVGISAFAVEALTDLVYAELPPIGREVTAGKPFGEIESVKAVSDLYSPVTGKVIATNQDLAGDLSVLNRDPYGTGWLVEIELASGQDTSGLLDYTAYQKQCAEEGH
jgi:glycine cleavage system H protein